MKTCPAVSFFSLNFPDSRFPEDGKVELLFSESPEKIAGKITLLMIHVLIKNIGFKCVYIISQLIVLLFSLQVKNNVSHS